MFCPKCGTKNDDANNFCFSCGASLTIKEGSTATESEPEDAQSSLDVTEQPVPILAAAQTEEKSASEEKRIEESSPSNPSEPESEAIFDSQNVPLTKECPHCKAENESYRAYCKSCGLLMPSNPILKKDIPTSHLHEVDWSKPVEVKPLPKKGISVAPAIVRVLIMIASFIGVAFGLTCICMALGIRSPGWIWGVLLVWICGKIRRKLF